VEIAQEEGGWCVEKKGLTIALDRLIDKMWVDSAHTSTHENPVIQGGQSGRGFKKPEGPFTYPSS